MVQERHLLVVGLFGSDCATDVIFLGYIFP